jgi:hypothetical protein
MAGMVSNLKMFCLFVLMLVPTVLILTLLHWIPLSIRNEGIRKYGSLEDVQRELQIKKIYLPSYFPERLQWPPFEIYAQNKPFTMVLMHVKERGRDHILLAIRQVDANFSSSVRLRIEPMRIKKKERVVIKGREAVLSLALCADGTVCNEIAWQEEGYTLTIVARSSARELIRIAESTLSR